MGTQTPFWWVPLQETRAVQPRYDQVINGITVGPGVNRQGGPCAGVSDANDPAQVQTRLYAEAKPGELAIEPRYLPTGAVGDGSADMAVYCFGVLAATGRDIYIPADRMTGRYGGQMHIQRYLGEPRAMVDLPALDFVAATVAGRPAVIVKPLTPGGLGDSAVVVAGDGLVSLIYAHGITVEELIHIAESLF